MFHYDICTETDKDIFRKHCKTLESHVPNIFKGELLEDVDGSETQIYLIGEKKISVHNSFYVGAVYVDSEVELESYLSKQESQITKNEYSAIENKMKNPDKKVICPRCGKELIYKKYGNSVSVKCKTKWCVSESIRGL